jgi:hypothetical protein
MKNKIFMKNKMFLAAAFAAALVFGMMFIACNNDSDPDPDPKGKDPFDEKPTEQRWNKFVDPSSTATLNWTVDSDGVCIVTVGGIAEPRESQWKARAVYAYTGKKDIGYAYEFETWTESGERYVDVQYYDGYNRGDVYYDFGLNINSTRQTYTLFGIPLPNGMTGLYFMGADQIGTFYIKIISIKEIQWQSLTITNVPLKYNCAYLSIWDDNGYVAYGQTISFSSGKVIFYLYEDIWDGEEWIGSKVWKGSGKYFIDVNFWNSMEDEYGSYIYTAGKELLDDPNTNDYKYTFTGGKSHTIDFNKFREVIYEDGYGEEKEEPTDPSYGG